MASNAKSILSDIIIKRENEVLQDWVQVQLASTTFRPGLINESDLKNESQEFLGLFREALQKDSNQDFNSSNWDAVKDYLSHLSGTRARKGFTPSETATFILSLKEPIFINLRKEGIDPTKLADEVWNTTILLDKLALYTTESYLRTREDVIRAQQQELLEISTPVVKLWEGVLALPLIGTLDSARTQLVMESLLQKIVDTGSAIAIIDITGVPAVDTLVAQHLLKTISATRLMGADCIISGIRPQIAQTMVHLGLSMSDVITKSTLADAFSLALEKEDLKIIKTQNQEQ